MHLPITCIVRTWSSREWNSGPLSQRSTHKSPHALANKLYCKDGLGPARNGTQDPCLMPSMELRMDRMELRTFQMRSTHTSPYALANNLYCKDLVQNGMELRTPVLCLVPTKPHMHLLIICIVRTWSSMGWNSGPMSNVWYQQIPTCTCY